MKKVLITGASGGIGSSISKKFLKNDFKLILTSSSNENINKLHGEYGDDHHYYILNFNNGKKVILKQ